MSHTVILELTFKEGMGANVLPGLLASLSETRAYQGAELIEPYTDSDNPDRIVIWEKWAARADQESYLNWRTETGAMEGLVAVLAEPPRFLHLTSAQ